VRNNKVQCKCGCGKNLSNRKVHELNRNYKESWCFDENSFSS